MQSSLMQHSSLVAFLSGILTAEAFAEEIADEVGAFYAVLLHAIATKKMPAEAAVYVADCIVASDDIEFADEATRDAVSFVEDDSSLFVDGRSEIWTQKEIFSALEKLN